MEKATPNNETEPTSNIRLFDDGRVKSLPCTANMNYVTEEAVPKTLKNNENNSRKNHCHGTSFTNDLTNHLHGTPPASYYNDRFSTF